MSCSEVGSAGPQSYGNDPRFALVRLFHNHESFLACHWQLRHHLRSSRKLKGMSALCKSAHLVTPRPYREPQAKAKMDKCSELELKPLAAQMSSLEILEAPGPEELETP